VFLIEQAPVKNPIFTYTFSYTLLINTRKSLMDNRDHELQSSHHPFIQYALSVVTNNILERDGDSIWFISGPGALTLAFCHFYRNQLRQLSIPEGVRIIDTYSLSNTVAQHLPLAYKHQGSHWNHTSQRQRALFRKPMGRPTFKTGEPKPFSKEFVGAPQEHLDS